MSDRRQAIGAGRIYRQASPGKKLSLPAQKAQILAEIP